MSLLTENNWRNIGGIVKQEIASGMNNQIDVNGQAYPALKPKTVMRKMKEGYPYPSKRLIATTNLINSSNIVEVDSTGVTLQVGQQRREIGYYHQTGAKPQQRPVPFFGVSEKCAKRILKYIDIEIVKNLKQIHPWGT